MNLTIPKSVIRANFGSYGHDVVDDITLSYVIADMLKAMYGHDASSSTYDPKSDSIEVVIHSTEVLADFYSKFICKGATVVCFDITKAKALMEALTEYDLADYRLIPDNRTLMLVMRNADDAMKLKLTIE